ncbi:hypothetical protein [Endozoicomonas sp. ONNA2]|uniref:hypothetical protein n=1 Tax=Endozoicomonas sp. ONNA2 TaxID=2828741 RepID=UPI00214814EA|nr:hypothetical protein [Endozoicomonas sp. ONNA2]
MAALPDDRLLYLYQLLICWLIKGSFFAKVRPLSRAVTLYRLSLMAFPQKVFELKLILAKDA